MKSKETTLLIKLPDDLKASFQGLCKARGVSVSEELRRFMADELADCITGMTTADKSIELDNNRIYTQNELHKSDRIKCDSTNDMFGDNS